MKYLALVLSWGAFTRILLEVFIQLWARLKSAKARLINSAQIYIVDERQVLSYHGIHQGQLGVLVSVSGGTGTLPHVSHSAQAVKVGGV